MASTLSVRPTALAMECKESPDHYHNSQLAMTRYLLLQNQRDALRKHMYDLCPTYPSTSTASTSLSVSPTRSYASSASTSPSTSKHTSPSRNHRRSLNAGRANFRLAANQLAPVLDECLVGEMAAGEQKLCGLNEGIKRTLTELLNCDAVRCKEELRTWVQTRLMETERELRTGRRRRSSGNSDY